MDSLVLFGDIFVKVGQNSNSSPIKLLSILGMFSSKKLFRLAFNTHHVENSGDQIVFTKDQLDPDKFKNEKHFDPNFTFSLILEPFEIDQTDENFKEELKGIEEIERVVKKIQGEKIQELDSLIYGFGDPEFDDRDESLILFENKKDKHHDASFNQNEKSNDLNESRNS